MKLQEVTAYEFKSQAILNESWQQLTESQRIYVGRWEKNVWPLMEQVNRLYEAELTTNQINTIFANAETVAGKDGGNLTAIGKAGKVTADVSKKLQAEIDKLLKAAQNSGPVKNFDQQFEKLKAQLKTKLEGNPMGQKILKMVDGYADFAKENPAKAAFVIGAMTSVLAFASGGVVSGATIGFFLKLASNTLKGDKLSSAIGKSVKGAAIGAAAGALGDALDKLLPAEVTNTFINDASGEIDITQLDGMDATSMADLDADAAKELIQTRSAMEELVARGDLDAEAEKILQGQLDQVNDKIREIGGGASINDTVDAMQDEFGIKGTDVDIEKTTSTSSTGQEEVVDTEVVSQLDAEQLNDAGINSADFPDNAWITNNTQKLLDAGLSEEDIEALQNAQGFNRALEQREFLGMKISASDAIEVGDSIDVEGVPDSVTVGETFKSTVTKTLPDGTEYTALTDTMIQGVDADGNPVYQVESVFVQPNPFTENLDKALENLPDDIREELYAEIFEKTVSGSMETAVDDMAGNIVRAAAAVGLGGALAQSEVKPADDEKAKAESIERHNEMIYEYVEYLEETMNEGPALDKMKAAAMAGVKKVGDLTQKGMTQVGKGMDKAGKAVQGGISKTAAGVKKQAKQLGNKITKEKLMKAWKKMGEPTDTGSIINILSDAGLDDESIGIVGDKSSIKLARPQADTGTDADASAGADPEAGAEPVDANKDGKDDNTGKPIEKPVDANKDGKDDKTGKPIDPKADATAGKPGAGGAAVGGAHAGKKPIVPGGAKAGATAGATAGKPVDVKTLASDIQKAGVADAVKQQLSQPAKAGSGGDLASGMKVDIPTLAKQISDAGVQDKVKASLTQKQPATA